MIEMPFCPAQKTPAKPQRIDVLILHGVKGQMEGGRKNNNWEMTNLKQKVTNKLCLRR